MYRKHLARGGSSSTPAKSFYQETIASEAAQHPDKYRKGTYQRKTTVTDMCDRCHVYMQMLKTKMPARTRGYKLWCKKCYHEHDGAGAWNRGEKVLLGEFRFAKPYVS